MTQLSADGGRSGICDSQFARRIGGLATEGVVDARNLLCSHDDGGGLIDHRRKVERIHAKARRREGRSDGRLTFHFSSNVFASFAASREKSLVLPMRTGAMKWGRLGIGESSKDVLAPPINRFASA